MSTRRGFLRLIGAAPVALPVAAKEAAVSMGLSGPIGAASAAHPGGSPGAAADKSWVMRRLAEMYSPEKQAEFRMQARHNARVLDADIAAMRSISPSTAFTIQVEREMSRILKTETTWLERQLKEIAH